eukprot:SAG11_NODE_12111_length_721_cov_1.112540_1_plen_36_part_10
MVTLVVVGEAHNPEIALIRAGSGVVLAPALWEAYGI